MAETDAAAAATEPVIDPVSPGEDGTPAAAAGVDITQNENYIAQAKARQVVGGVICYILGLCTLLLVAAQCWDVYHNNHSLDWITVSVTTFPVMWISVSYMGMLGKERRDILSAVVGESEAKSGGFIESLLQFLVARRMPR